MKCDLCDKPAVVHEVTVKGGAKTDHHLCVDHAREAGIEVLATEPIKQMLTQFVLQRGKGKELRTSPPACPGCGITYPDFRKQSVLGCPECYLAFDKQLSPLIEKSQGGATHHVGKSPRRAGGSIDRQRLIQQIVRELDEAVAAEQYERAAKLRDKLTHLKCDVVAEPKSVITTRRARRTSDEEVNEV